MQLANAESTALAHCSGEIGLANTGMVGRLDRKWEVGVERSNAAASTGSPAGVL